MICRTGLKKQFFLFLLLVIAMDVAQSQSMEGALGQGESSKNIKAEFPRIEFVRSGQVKKGANKALVQNFKNSEKPVDLKKNDVLTEHAKIVTSADAEVKIALDPYTQVIVFENSVLELPVITWGQGEVLDLQLQKGKIQVSCEKDCVRQYTTPLSKNVFTNGVFILDYRPEFPYVELTALHGEQEFRGLENESMIKIKGGQKVVFQGLKENDEVAYDVLLKGRKVARGQLQAVVTLPANEIEALDDKSKKLKPIVVAKIPAPPRLPNQICEAPFAELNQCAWTCEGLSKKKKPMKNIKTCDISQAGVHCVRRRCNANGQWEDATILTQSAQRCETQPIVAGCDY